VDKVSPPPPSGFRVFTSFRRDPKNISDGRSLEYDKLGINLRMPKRNTTYFTKHFSKISRILWHGITFLVIPALELPSRPSYFYLLDCVSSLDLLYHSWADIMLAPQGREVLANTARTKT